AAQGELLRLDDGDVLSVQGGLRAEAYEKGGELRVRLTVLADAVLSLRRPRKGQGPERQEQAAGYGDAVPFWETSSALLRNKPAQTGRWQLAVCSSASKPRSDARRPFYNRSKVAAPWRCTGFLGARISGISGPPVGRMRVQSGRADIRVIE